MSDLSADPGFRADASSPQAVSTKGFNPGRKTLDQMMEEAMGPRKNPLQPIFRDHNCGGCDSGRLPCREGNYNCCSYPHARND